MARKSTTFNTSGDGKKTSSPDFFFEDQTRHCELAAPLVPTTHVPFGVMNELFAQAKQSKKATPDTQCVSDVDSKTKVTIEETT